MIKLRSEWRVLITQLKEGDTSGCIGFNPANPTQLEQQTLDALYWAAVIFGDGVGTDDTGAATGQAAWNADGSAQREFANGLVVFNPGYNNNVVINGRVLASPGGALWS